MDKKKTTAHHNICIPYRLDPLIDVRAIHRVPSEAGLVGEAIDDRERIPELELVSANINRKKRKHTARHLVLHTTDVLRAPLPGRFMISVDTASQVVCRKLAPSPISLLWSRSRWMRHFSSSNVQIAEGLRPAEEPVADAMGGEWQGGWQRGEWQDSSQPTQRLGLGLARQTRDFGANNAHTRSRVPEQGLTSLSQTSSLRPGLPSDFHRLDLCLKLGAPDYQGAQHIS
jgi:hypothetical protein